MSDFMEILIQRNHQNVSTTSERTIKSSLIEEVLKMDSFDKSLEDSPLLSEGIPLNNINYKKLIRDDMIEFKRSHIPNHEVRRAVCDHFRSRIRLDYELYKSMSMKMPLIMKRFFTAEVFLKLPRDTDSCILVEDLLGYINFHCILEETMLDIAAYAHSDSGFIEELELERYIFDSIPSFVPLQNVHESMYPFITITAVKRFMFFLDPHKTRRVNIKKLVQSPMMRDFLELRTKTQLPASNWFSYANVRMVYSQYLDLDSEKRGTLCQEDLRRFTGIPKGSIQLTPAIVSRIFEENISYQPPEMDYKAFLDLVLALENRQTFQSIRYFFRLLDIEGTGRLTSMSIMFFYTDICKCLRAWYDTPPLKEVTGEIYDMASAMDPAGLTLDELLRSGQGGTITEILTDPSAFWRYDNREALMQRQDEEEEEDLNGEDERVEDSDGKPEF